MSDLPAKNKITELSEYLNSRKSAIAAVLPKHLTPDRLAKIAFASISRAPLLMQCTVPSLYMAITQAAQLGLEPGLQGSCYLVPFYNNKNKSYEAVFMPGFRGLIDLCRRSKEVKKIEAHVVYETDQFEYEYGIETKLRHVPAKDLSPTMVCVYAIAWLTNGETQFEVMSANEVNSIRSSSKAKDKGPWETHTSEMWRKTAVKRLAKYLPMSIELRQALEVEDAAESGQTPIVGLEGEKIFEAEVVQEPTEKQKKVHDKVKEKVSKKPKKQADLKPDEKIPDGKFALSVTGNLETHGGDLVDNGFVFDGVLNCYAMAGMDYQKAKSWVEFFSQNKELTVQVLSETTGEEVTVEPY